MREATNRKGRRGSAPQQRPRRRSGAIMIVVAGGIITLLSFGAIALDVGYMHLSRARAEAAARAAARAGLEKMKQLDFDLTGGNQAIVEGVVRDYLEQNGSSATEATNADVDIERCGDVTVSVTRESPIYLGHFAGNFADDFSGKVDVQGKVEMECNKLAPFAIPTTYHDPDRDGFSNWQASTEEITLTPMPWAWTADKPYIVKYGRDSGQAGETNNWVFIPMERSDVLMSLPGGGFTIPAQDFAGSLNATSETFVGGSGDGPGQRNTLKSNVGVLRAYGVAYDVAAVKETDPDAKLFWCLGLSGGGFLMRADDLLAAGYQVPAVTDELNAGTNSKKFTILETDGTSTHVVALMIRSLATDPDARPLDLEFIERIAYLNEQTNPMIRLIEIPKQPKIVTFTEGNDYVTMAMINAGIPFKATFFTGDTTGFHDFPIAKGATAASYLSTLDAEGPFDWLHLHHENFAVGWDSNPYEQRGWVEAIHEFVTTRHGFIFAACWASETLEMALARVGSPKWTSKPGYPARYVADWGADPDTQAIEYGKTFAFQDFFINDRSRHAAAVGWKDRYQGRVPKLSFHRDTELHCGGHVNKAPASGGHYCWEDSEIDNEFNEHRPSGGSNALRRRIAYTDYMNPLLQGHGGFFGRQFDEATQAVASADTNDYVIGANGYTSSFRYHGSVWTHCDASNPTLQPIPQHRWSYHSLYESGVSDVHRDDKNPPESDNDDDRYWVREATLQGGWQDINGNGAQDFVRVRDLPNYPCPDGTDRAIWPNPSQPWRVKFEDVNCDGTSTRTTSAGSNCSRWNSSSLPSCGTQEVCTRVPPGDSETPPGPEVCETKTKYLRTWPADTANQGHWNTLMRENDNGFRCYDAAHGQVILKPHIVAQGGITEPELIPGANPTTKMMILSRDIADSPLTDLINIEYTRYISGIADDNNNIVDGFGRWSYLGGHEPDRLNGDAMIDGFGVLGLRTYLNNILFGATAGVTPGGVFTPGTGAVNAGSLGLGGAGGEFGAGGYTDNSYRTQFRIGSKGIGVPVGAKFRTAPGNFKDQTADGMAFATSGGSMTWAQFQTFRASNPDEVNSHPQVFVLPIVERIPDTTPPSVPITYPTPENELDDWLNAGSSPPASDNAGSSLDGTGGARALSMYAGNPLLPEDDPQQARTLHVVGFARFFLIDENNQGPDTQDPGDNGSFVAAEWKEGELRGYFLEYVEQPAGPVVYPASPLADPR